MEVKSQGTQSDSGSEPPYLHDGSELDSSMHSVSQKSANSSTQLLTAAGSISPPSLRRCSLSSHAITPGAQNGKDPEPLLRSLRSWPVLLNKEHGAKGLTASGSSIEETQSTLIYIDRIPADASAAMITEAVEAGIGQVRRGSLDVIRKHKTKHCHAFAQVIGIWSPAGSTSVNLSLNRDEEIRVAVSDLSQRSRPITTDITTSRSTLRIRLYAQRKSWLEPVSRLTWTGVLVILKNITPAWSYVAMLADDMKKKKPGSWSHPSVLLGAYFADCGTAMHAELLKLAVHDRRACINDVHFLVEAQYTCEDKHLHEKGKQTTAERKFASAREKASDDDVDADDLVVKKKGKPAPGSTCGSVTPEGSPLAPAPLTFDLQESSFNNNTADVSSNYSLPHTPASSDAGTVPSPVYPHQQLQHVGMQMADPVLSLLAEPLDEVLGKYGFFRDLFFGDFSEQARSRYRAQWNGQAGPSSPMYAFVAKLFKGGFFDIPLSLPVPQSTLVSPLTQGRHPMQYR
eukprot:TRINITY_DN4082_c0_g2_i1.p1 TRINITY_DN4082_c0_g2~~TRINITY_DN4082_c0_g2_i1.p1  ORF type:complete len:542 (+),score=59.39 TRINITY_DN4082_c0_g2_i1:87-1628(+)